MKKRKLMSMGLVTVMLTISIIGCGDSGDKSSVSAIVTEATNPVTDSMSVADEVTGEAVEVTGEAIDVTTVQPETVSAASNAASNKSEADNSGSGGSSSSTAKQHTHNWKEHMATQQVWVPNIVTVDDYEDQEVVIGGYYECDCGARFELSKEGAAALEEHQETNLLNAARNGTLDECRCFGNTGCEYYDTQPVKVGSHEEDHGHYETSTYVDYYYCDCGATK